MKILIVAAGVVTMGVMAAGTAAAAGSSDESSCLQPNRRVSIEIGGIKIKPAPKPKPDAKPDAKPGKPGRESVMLKALAQGDSAFDPGSAVLKDGGKAELDKLVNTVAKGAGKDTRPTEVGSVVISGHSDRLETKKGDTSLSENRAKAVMAYVMSKGIDSKLIFWEGKGVTDPMPVTKFCEPAAGAAAKG